VQFEEAFGRIFEQDSLGSLGAGLVTLLAFNFERVVAIEKDLTRLPRSLPGLRKRDSVQCP
jgi:hypothetical protein